MQVIRSILRCAVSWWCIKQHQPLPYDGSKWKKTYRAAVLQLTSNVFNNDGRNVVELAIFKGAVALIDELFNTQDVYRFDDESGIKYDITKLMPLTTRPTSDSEDSETTTRSSIELRELTPQTTTSDSHDSETENSKSCLDLIMEMKDEILAAQILDVSPFRQLVQDYWRKYRWLYGTLMLVHIVYMIAFTICVLPDIATLLQLYNVSSYNVSSTQSCRSLPTFDPFGLFLIWPSFVLAFLVYYTAPTFLVYYTATTVSRYYHGFNSINNQVTCHVM